MCNGARNLRISASMHLDARRFVQNIEGRTHAEPKYELHVGENTSTEQMNELQNNTIRASQL